MSKATKGKSITHFFLIGQIVLISTLVILVYTEVVYHAMHGHISPLGWLPALAFMTIVTKMWIWTYREIKEEKNDKPSK